MQSNLYTGEEAQEKLLKGFNLVADAVKLTLGGAGSDAVLEDALPPYSVITNDGVSIAQAINPTDPIEKMGANLAKEIASKADKESNDGTTTALTIAQAALNLGFQAKISGRQLKQEIYDCLPIIFKSLDEQTKEIDVDSVAQVATVSAEDEAMGALLQEIYQQIGKDGIIELDNSNTADTYYQIKEGVRLRNCGYMAPYMANSGVSAVYKKPKILITKQKIGTLMDVDPLFQKLTAEGISEVVIFCEEIDPSVLSALAFTHKNGIFKTLVIKAPKLWKDWLFEDFAKITGATIVLPETGVTLKSVELSHLGTCQQLMSTKEDTTVIGISDIADHIAQLETESVQNDQLKVRISWLKTKAAVLKLGANSESELTYKVKKAQDAVGASHLALKGGVVAGGGVALLNASRNLLDTAGGNVMKEALAAPISQIYKNATGEDIIVIGNGSNRGFDAKTLKNVDMFEAGIVDPALVTKNSVKSAISVIGTLLTIKSAIHLPEKKPETKQHPYG